MWDAFCVFPSKQNLFSANEPEHMKQNTELVKQKQKPQTPKDS